jgi:hypothetical protein
MDVMTEKGTTCSHKLLKKIIVALYLQTELLILKHNILWYARAKATTQIPG